MEYFVMPGSWLERRVGPRVSAEALARRGRNVRRLLKLGLVSEMAFEVEASGAAAGDEPAATSQVDLETGGDGGTEKQPAPAKKSHHKAKGKAATD